MKNYIKMIFFLFFLSAISAGLLTAFHLEFKERIEKNKQQEQLVHILKSMAIVPDSIQEILDNELQKLPTQTEHDQFLLKATEIKLIETELKKYKDLSSFFADSIQVLEITKENTKQYTGGEFLAKFSQFDFKHNLYIFKADIGKQIHYCFEIIGVGFWDKIAGYLTLKQGWERIAGITFYDHKETPGLGQRIEEGWFQAQFSFWDKTIFSNDEKQPSLHISKRLGTYDGECTEKFSKKENEVDAITGASETSRGLDKSLTECLRNVFSKISAHSSDQNVQEFFDEESLERIKQAML